MTLSSNSLHSDTNSHKKINTNQSFSCVSLIITMQKITLDSRATIQHDFSNLFSCDSLILTIQEISLERQSNTTFLQYPAHFNNIGRCTDHCPNRSIRYHNDDEALILTLGASRATSSLTFVTCPPLVSLDIGQKT